MRLLWRFLFYADDRMSVEELIFDLIEFDRLNPDPLPYKIQLWRKRWVKTIEKLGGVAPVRTVS